eukprot:13951127-Ditylum_brightwellii.AAC.1
MTEILPDIPNIDEQNGYEYFRIVESTNFLTNEKLLTINGLLHLKSSKEKLYLHQSRGRRGLTGVGYTHTEECLALVKYVMTSDSPFTKIVLSKPFPTQKHLMHYASALHFCLSDLTNDAHQKTLLKKPLHGSWFCQQVEIPQIDINQSHIWLARADPRGETEALICAAQEQVLATNYVRNMIYKQPVLKLCCLC